MNAVDEAPKDVIGRAGAVLRAVSAAEPDGAGTSSIARQCQLARATAHRVLSSLQAEGFIDRDETTGHWLLGPELYLLGSRASQRYDVTHLALPSLRRLSDATGESAFFSARRGEESVCLAREDGSFPIRSHVLYEGIRFPLGVASAGLAMLAHLPDPQVDSFLERADLVTTYGDSHAPDQLWKRIRRTRKDGYATNPGLIVEGSWGLAATVFDSHDRPGWALSLTGVEQRFDRYRRHEMGTLLLKEAHALTTALRRSGA